MTQLLAAALAIMLLIIGTVFYRTVLAAPADETLLVVLGSHRKSVSKARVNCAIEYIAKRGTSVLLFAGRGPGIKQGYSRTSEADFMKWYYMQRIGLSPSFSPPRVLIENKSMNTYENVKNSLTSVNALYPAKLNVVLLSTHDHVRSAAEAWKKGRPEDRVAYIQCPSLRATKVRKAKKKK